MTMLNNNNNSGNSINKYCYFMFATKLLDLGLFFVVFLNFFASIYATYSDNSLKVHFADAQTAKVSFYLKEEGKFFFTNLRRHSVVSKDKFSLSLDGKQISSHLMNDDDVVGCGAYRAEEYEISESLHAPKAPKKGLVVVDLNLKVNPPTISGFILLPEAEAKDKQRIEIQIPISTSKSEQEPRNFTCGTDQLIQSRIPFNSSFFSRSQEHQRNGNEKVPHFGHEGCPTSRKVIYIGTVADCSYVRTFPNEDIDLVKAEILSTWNKTSAIYERTFNVSLVLVQVIILKECSPLSDNGKLALPFNRLCSMDYPLVERLSDFSDWRATQNNTDIPIWHLFTGCSTGTVYGLAWLKQFGRHQTLKDAQGHSVNGSCITAKSRNEFSLVAHEIGHVLGSYHDCDSQLCSVGPKSPNNEIFCEPCGMSCDCRGKYIMTPESAGENLTEFSGNSIERICQNLSVNGKYLMEPGSRKGEIRSFCGNGIREEGEECDPGANENDPCCTKDCKLRPGAVCSDLNDACCRNCSVIARGERQICFKADGPCQTDSICDGVNSSCPPVILIPDGTSCESKRQFPFDENSPRCANGMCTSKDIQCRNNALEPNQNLQACEKYTTSCKMICSNSKECIFYNLNFLDGTACGKGGICKQGKCIGSSLSAYASDYWEFVVIFILLVLLALLTIVMACLRSRQNRESRDEN